MLKQIIFFIACVISASTLFAQEDPSFFYQKGVDAKSIGERESNFEKALKLYMKEQIAYKEEGKENGYLLFNIGNCYFNLNQLGESILYYKQALKLLPNEEKILQNYEIAMKKRVAAVDIEDTGKLSETLLFFHYSLTEKIKIILMFSFSAMILILFLLNIKLNTPIIKKTCILLTVLYFTLLSSLFVSYFYPHREGVFVKDSFVYQDVGENYASLVSKPIGTGSSIRVIQMKDGWFKVRLNDGRFGFVKEDSLRMIL